VRIVEFPRYTRRAASFPNTIPFSESIGFIARVEGPEAIDIPFYVTAHEVAHQWWGYQVLGADVQGAAMLSETMAQYSALMVARKEFGDARMRRFLRHELDGYLSGRGDEVREETPLALVENQGYIHYRKGSLVLYALQDALGEDRLNAALRDYVQEVRFAPPPYTVSRDLLAHVAKIVPPAQPHLLEDLFSTITLYDLAATEATSHRRADGKYEVTVKARARKLRSTGKGVESEVPIDDWIDVGILADRDADGGEPALYLRKEHVTGPEVTVTVVVDGEPRRAGIDPYHKLIDRTPADNVRSVEAR
jgi:aminopeptidase N